MNMTLAHTNSISSAAPATLAGLAPDTATESARMFDSVPKAPKAERARRELDDREAADRPLVFRFWGINE